MTLDILVRREIRITLFAIALACIGWAGAALGDTFSVDWHTIDGGGGQDCTGGGFTLSGTVGQPDAGPPAGAMTGGGFSLVGGFWAGAASVCPLPGDMNGDGLRNGRDIQGFVNCLTGTGTCFCGDTNTSGAADVGDILTFVAFLLS